MSKDNMVILPHILAIFTGFIGPLVTMIAGDGELKQHSKKALNWQISLLIYFVVSAVLALVLIGFLLMMVLGVMNLVFCILGAVKAADGELWDYPLTINFFK
jgi:uncharacterized Tic20 family protein